MKVLQINATYGFGSTGRNAKEQHEYYLSQGIESYVAYAIRGEKNERVFRIGTFLDHKFHALMTRITGKQGYYSYFATKKLLKKMNKLQPDIVHLHNLHSNYIHLPSLLKYLAKNKIATVLTLHDFWLFTGGCCHYLYENCEKFQTDCGNCPSLKNAHCPMDFSKKMLEERKTLFSQIPKLAIVGVSKWCEQETEKSFFKDFGEKTYIYNWVDRNTFYPRKKIENKEKTIVAASQNWGDKKGLSQALDLAKRLGQGVKLILIGNINKKIKLPQNVLSVGYISDANKLAEYYSNADCFVHFSKIETFGKVVIEAMACGTPAVVFNSTALGELVDGECGIAVPPNDVDAMANAVKEILSKGKDYYQEKCFAYAYENFNYETQAEKYIELYKGLLNKR